MTQGRREWLSTFADPAVLSDARAAAESCMREICQHKPEECDCRANLMTPTEFVDWLEAEIHAAKREPVRFEKGHRPKARNGEGLTLAVAVG